MRLGGGGTFRVANLRKPSRCSSFRPAAHDDLGDVGSSMEYHINTVQHSMHGTDHEKGQEN